VDGRAVWGYGGGGGGWMAGPMRGVCVSHERGDVASWESEGDVACMHGGIPSIL
jgi:hypothetical protein